LSNSCKLFALLLVVHSSAVRPLHLITNISVSQATFSSIYLIVDVGWRQDYLSTVPGGRHWPRLQRLLASANGRCRQRTIDSTRRPVTCQSSPWRH